MDNNLEVNYLKKELYELIKSDESIFDFIQESSVDGLWYWDLENPENEWMNPKFWMVLGYNPKEMPHKSSSWQSIINQDDLKAAMERVAFHLENPNHPYDQIVRYTHKNGSTVWIRCRGMAIRDKNGKPVRMLGAHHDISELKTLGEDLILLNEKAEENNSNIKAILEGTKDSIWSFDRNYNIIYINNIFQNEFESSFGIRLEKGSNLIMALPEYLRPFWEPRYNRVLSGEQFSIVDEVDTAIGRLYILVTFNPIIKNGVVTGGSCFGSNITERKKAEYELQQSQKRLSEKEAQYRLLAENSQDLIYVYNLVPEPRYEYISPSCLQLTGYEPEICYSDPFTYHKFINTSSGLERFTQFLLNPEQPPRIEEEWKRKDGSYIWVEQVVARNFDENGNLISFQSTVRDITERKHAEERLRESEEKYRIYVETSQDAIFSVDKKGYYQFANRTFAYSLGFTPEYFDGKSFWDIYPKDLADMRYENVRKVFETGKPNEIEVVVPLPDRTLYFLAKTNPISDTKGNVIQVLVTATDITERRKAESELLKAKERIEESEAFYRQTFEESPVGIAHVNPKGQFIKVNKLFCEIIGYTENELLNLTIENITYPDDLKIEEVFINKVLNNEIDKFSIEKRYIHKNGHIIWIALHSNVVRDKNHEALFAISTITDITERIELQTELLAAKESAEESETKFKAAFYTSPDSVNINKLDGEYVEINEGFTRLTGFTTKDVISKLSSEIDIWAIPEDRQKLIEGLKKDGIVENLESLFRAKDGTIIPAQMSAKIIVLNDEPHILSVTRDIRKQKKYEMELIAAKEKAELSEERTRLLIELAPDSFLHGDKEGNIIGVNNQATEMFGYSKEELLSMNIKELFPPEVIEYEPLRYDLLKRGEAVKKERKIRKKNSEIIYVEMNSRAMRDGTYQSFIRDITERKKAEEEILLAKEKAEESDRLKSAFLANMSHEIRTPMNGILGFANLLKQPNVDGNEKLEYIEIIEKSGQRMLNIINDIIDISKIEAGLIELKLTESNINEQIEFIYTFFKAEANGKGLKLTVKNPSFTDKLYLNTDREKLYAVLTNLVKNAIKYTEKGEIEIGFVPKGKFIEFYVKDTGIGIPDDRKHAIFERFIQADIEDMMARQGAGLGLAISKAYIEMMGGTIWVESEVGKGSVFIFNLPFDSKIENKPKIQSSQPVDDSFEFTSTINILIAEDDIISEKLLEYELKSYIKKLYKTRSGLEAVEIMRNNPDIQLILMDIRMPQMNGYEATRQIRQFNKNVIIIAQTAYGLTGDREKAKEAGCNDYIAKPIQKEELLKKIEKYIIGVDRK